MTPRSGKSRGPALRKDQQLMQRFPRYQDIATRQVTDDQQFHITELRTRLSQGVSRALNLPTTQRLNRSTGANAVHQQTYRDFITQRKLKSRTNYASYPHPIQAVHSNPYAHRYHPEARPKRPRNTLSNHTAATTTKAQHDSSGNNPGLVAPIRASAAPEVTDLLAAPLKPDLLLTEKLRLIPIFVGLIFPLVLLVNVLPITGAWVKGTTDSASGNPPTDTLYAGNGAIQGLSIVALVLSFVSMAAFFFRCVEMRLALFTLIGIVFATASGLCQLASGPVFLVLHSHDPRAALTMQIYSSFVAASASFLVAGLLFYDWKTTENFRFRGSGLTDRQRVLFIVSLLFISWAVAGGMMFSRLEHWNLVAGIHFCVVTMTTTGFGNLVPTHTVSKALTFPFGLVGILLFGFSVNAIHTVFIEVIENRLNAEIERIYHNRRQYRQRLRRDAKRLLMGHQFLYTWVDPNDAFPNNIPSASTAASHYTSELSRSYHLAPSPIVRGLRERGWSRSLRSLKPRVSMAEGAGPNTAKYAYSQYSPQETVNNSSEPAAVGHGLFQYRRRFTRKQFLGYFRKPTDQTAKADRSHEASDPDPLSLGAQLKTIERRSRHQLWYQFGYALACWLTFWAIGAAMFSPTMDISYFNALYFCFVAFTTIGFGDYYPNNQVSQLLYVVYALVGIATITYFISTLTTIWRRVLRTHIKQVEVRRRLVSYYYSHLDHMESWGQALFSREHWARWWSVLWNRFSYRNRGQHDMVRPPIPAASEPVYLTSHAQARPGTAQPTGATATAATTASATNGDDRLVPDGLSSDAIVSEYHHRYIPHMIRDQLEELLDAAHNFDALSFMLLQTINQMARQPQTAPGSSRGPASGQLRIPSMLSSEAKAAAKMGGQGPLLAPSLTGISTPTTSLLQSLRGSMVAHHVHQRDPGWMQPQELHQLTGAERLIDKVSLQAQLVDLDSYQGKFTSLIENIEELLGYLEEGI
ncbi:Potassium channel [Dimargaris verticillata]|uniref:Potassium channel n=1 Tax=Dimargaris verticillata TaxID=2761393 RepID=A0A9W8B591_9FUNG|nr:Potassium channel [Dimargaris verticillata]